LLDRDGTIMIDHGYVGRADQVELLPDAACGLRLLGRWDVPIVVVTNQSGVHRGYFTMKDVELVNSRLADLLLRDGVELAGFYICPHGPESDCTCRKPGVALALDAASELQLDLDSSVVIGDKESDVQLGLGIGAATVLLAPVGTESRADVVVPDWASLIPKLEEWCKSGSLRIGA
jgi:histidinol-phosphate phosphatase family protein